MENSSTTTTANDEMLSFEDFRQAVLSDYKTAVISRETSLLGRKEVLTGKAKFGIFGDGKEVAQIAMAKYFKPGDWRSGYYRDQTFAFAKGISTPKQLFAQLYADPDVSHDPASAGRQMVSHFATPNFDKDGNVLPLAKTYNVAADMAPTGSQMPRGVGLALASKLFRNIEELQQNDNLSDHGNEVCFCTIGDASTSEGHFWETINAAGVLQIPLAVFVWDDGYGISVPKKYQTTKGSISSALKGFQKKEDSNGIDIYKLKGWDYAGMCEVLETAVQKIRDTHVPALFHVEEITQPQGHSTSGSHERYKSAERLDWEREWDCNRKMKEWIISSGLATAEELTAIDDEAKQYVKDCRNAAWAEFTDPIKEESAKMLSQLESLRLSEPSKQQAIQHEIKKFKENRDLLRRDIMHTLFNAVLIAGKENVDLRNYYESLKAKYSRLYDSWLYIEDGKGSALEVEPVAPAIDDNAPAVNGFEVLNKYFEKLFETRNDVVAFGEDVGYIGDVNQAFSNLQQKFTENRIFDTGIRELTIMGQAIGLAMRGFRPIAEIQYLDYLIYGLQPLSDDVSTLLYRTSGQQRCPLIIRTRGHRLEGIWHSGSPMGMIINSLRGMYVCVPRNMTQAAGMYNTIMKSSEPALIIECLNGYRLKEKLPSNLLEMNVPMGVPEILREGTDVTIVSYGSVLRIIDEAARELDKYDISCEIIDVQTLLPFDIHHSILNSLKKTNRIVFIDEDVPGGAAAYMFNKVMEEQNGYRWLDVAARTITGKAHRPAYGSDGDYFSKPNVEEIVSTIMQMMAE